MKQALVLLLTIIVDPSLVRAQSEKPAIDTGAFRTWPAVQSPCISNDGKFVSYLVNNQPAGSETLVIQPAKNTSGKKEFIRGRNCRFSNDSRYAVFQKGNDSLCPMTLNTSDLSCIKNIASWRMPEGAKQNQNWLAARLKGIDMGYEADPAGRCGKNCSSCTRALARAGY